MKEHPIIFKGDDEAIQAILDGSKTQDRRPLKVQGVRGKLRIVGNENYLYDDDRQLFKPTKTGLAYRLPWSVGDLLWVRETCATWEGGNCDNPPCRVAYATASNWDAIVSDAKTLKAKGYPRGGIGAWEVRPSSHMPRWASRITLEVTGVRVERVQEISEADALAEGCPKELGGEYCVCGMQGNRVWFMDLWDSIYAKRGQGWDTNPWVSVLEFKLINSLTPTT